MSIVQEENKRIIIAYKRLLKTVNETIGVQPKENILRKAFEVAVDAHKNQRRKSGEPYILHPIEVARLILSEMKLHDFTSVIAALLHDVVEDNEDYTIEYINKHFGPEIAQMVSSLTKIKRLSRNAFSQLRSRNVDMNLTRADLTGGNQLLLLKTIVQDPRIILIKFADRLHNMRTIQQLNDLKRKRIIAETEIFYIALAYRLGLYKVKSELEDIAFHYSYPDEYAHIENSLKTKFKHQESFIEEFKKEFKNILESLNLRNIEITGRLKNIYSIYKKIKRKKVSINEIYDYYAIRIVFDCKQEEEINLCTQIFKIINNTYKNSKKRHRNWLVETRSNNYQAIHTTIFHKEAKNWIEVQIRTKRMHEMAEYGLAAHWNYKNVKLYPPNLASAFSDDKLEKWFEHIRKALTDKDYGDKNWNEISARLSKDFFGVTITVFTAQGQQQVLPKDATVLDFAFHVNKDKALKCLAAKVNYEIKEKGYPLKNGDIVEFLDSDSVQVDQDWLILVTTDKAKYLISKHLDIVRQKMIVNGKDILKKILEENKLPYNEKLIKHFYQNVYDNEEDFLCDLGMKKVPDLSFELGLNDTLKPKIIDEKPNEQGDIIFIGGQDKKRLADCCKPLLGDDIVGIRRNITSKDNLEVHRTTCLSVKNVLGMHKNALVKVKWQKADGVNETCIYIHGLEKKGLIGNIAQKLNYESNFNINGLFISLDKSGAYFSAILSVDVQNAKILERILREIKTVEGVREARRIEDEYHFKMKKDFSGKLLQLLENSL